MLIVKIVIAEWSANAYLCHSMGQSAFQASLRCSLLFLVFGGLLDYLPVCFNLSGKDFQMYCSKWKGTKLFQRKEEGPHFVDLERIYMQWYIV